MWEGLERGMCSGWTSQCSASLLAPYPGFTPLGPIHVQPSGGSASHLFVHTPFCPRAYR